MSRSRLALLTMVLMLGLVGSSGVAAEEPGPCQLTAAERTAVDQAYNRLAQARIVRGTALMDIDPDQYYRGRMTRAEFAVLLYRAMGWPEPSGTGAASFSDVQTHWSRPYLAPMQQAGLIRGDAQGAFRPDDAIELAHAKLMIARLLRLAPEPPLGAIDQSLASAGIDPALPCSQEQQALRGQLMLLLDRMASAPLYARHQG